jgi:hypothetical protein
MAGRTFLCSLQPKAPQKRKSSRGPNDYLLNDHYSCVVGFPSAFTPLQLETTFQATLNVQEMKQSQFYQLYGPVPSMRLGRSLGVDLVPFKTRSYDPAV